VANVTLSELCQKHSKAVEEIAQSLDGVAFNQAPFDIVSKKGNQFYEVKTVSKLKGRHKGECRISITQDELNFASIFPDNFTIIILFDTVRFDVPFHDLEERIMHNKTFNSPLGGFQRLHRQITLGKSFLKKYSSHG
jgi:hypothetical protein